MDSWFTVEQIDQDTFVISEYRHWEETHCYLLCGTKRAILIDTGLGVSNIREVIDGLTKLPVTVITTHVHWDHIGGHKYFRSIAVHEAEKEWLSVKFPIPCLLYTSETVSLYILHRASLRRQKRRDVYKRQVWYNLISGLHEKCWLGSLAV